MFDRLLNWFAYLLSTVFGIGKVPFAPGTLGSLVAVLPFLLWQPSISVMLIMVVASFLIGAWSAGVAERFVGMHDPSQVIIDELCGTLVAILTCHILGQLFLGRGLVLIQQLPTSISNAAVARKIVFHNTVFLVAIFVVFRLFDILKPFPIGYIDKHMKGGLGIMLDDLIAGLIAGGAVFAIGFLW